MDTGTKDVQHQTPESQVAPVKRLGYDGIGIVGFAQLSEFLESCDRHGLRLFNIYVALNIDAGQPFDSSLEQGLPKLQGHGAMLWLSLISQKHQPSAPDGDPEAMQLLGRVAQLAAKSGVKVALYPHASFWLERTDDAVRLAQKASRPEVGVTFNLCHFLRVEKEADLEAVLERAKPHLFVVSLNGAESGRRGADWKELIQTLDRGSFDNLRLLKVLKQIRFTGPIGLQGYGIGGDVEDNLRRSMNAWRQLRTRSAAGEQP
jgi:sugar phosphate isomerase/epimerase